ncbi:hypothetical protein Tco_0573052 [Tanacetum coccineum]
MDLVTTDASTQQKLEKMDEEFTTTAYLNVQENLKLLTEDQFFVEKPQEEEPGKTNAEADVQLSTPNINSNNLNNHNNNNSSTTTTSKNYRSDPSSSHMLYKLENLNIPHQVSKVVDEIVSDAVDWAMQAPLQARFRDLPTVDMKEILQQRMFEDNTYKTHEVYNDLYEALQKSVELDYSNQRLADQEEAHKKKRKRRESPRTPPGSSPTQPPLPPPPVGVSCALDSQALSSSKTAALASQSMAWTTSDTQYESADIPEAQELSPTDYLMHDDSTPEEQVLLSDDEYSENDHQPKADLRKDWWKPLPKEGRSATPEPAWTIPSSNKCHSPSVLDGGVSQDAQSSDLEYLRYGSKGSNPALSISKMKAASYLDFGLELLKFNIDRHDSPSRRIDVRTHMWILSVVRIKAYSRYRYDYLCEIVLRRANFQEHTIAKKDFKNLYPSDFEDLNLLLLQGHLDHLPGLDKRMLSTAVKLWTQNLVIRQRVEDFQLGIESYQKQLNLTKLGWDETGYEFKHDYTIIESPRAVVFPVNNNERKIMRQAVQTVIPNNAAFQTEDLDTYDSDCDDISNAQAVLMANISNYGSDVISKVPHSETYLNDMVNQGAGGFANKYTTSLELLDLAVHNLYGFFDEVEFFVELDFLQRNNDVSIDQNNSLIADVEHIVYSDKFLSQSCKLLACPLIPEMDPIHSDHRSEDGKQYSSPTAYQCFMQRLPNSRSEMAITIGDD